jgi:hypothetical protein
MTELLKKYIRDGTMDDAVLQAGLSETLAAWVALSAAAGFSARELLAENHEKVSRRVEFDTLRGSGDHR